MDTQLLLVAGLSLFTFFKPEIVHISARLQVDLKQFVMAGALIVCKVSPSCSNSKTAPNIMVVGKQETRPLLRRPANM